VSAGFTQATLILKPLAIELNSSGMCKKSGFKSYSLIFPCTILHKKGKEKEKERKKENTPKWLYKNVHNWQKHTVRRSGIEPSTLRRRVCTARRQKRNY